MRQHEREVEDARARIAASGRAPDDFLFDVTYLEPDPDGGGMFTVQYEIRITNIPTSKGLKTIGGIGSRWVDYFEEKLKGGHFD